MIYSLILQTDSTTKISWSTSAEGKNTMIIVAIVIGIIIIGGFGLYRYKHWLYPPGKGIKTTITYIHPRTGLRLANEFKKDIPGCIHVRIIKQRTIDQENRKHEADIEYYTS